MVRKKLDDEKAKERWDLTEEEQKKVVQLEVDYEHIDNYKDQLAGHSHAFCCLGSTRAKAGSAEAFRHIDFDYVANTSKLLKAGGTKHFSLLTSQGSNKDSWLLYPQVKGQIEAEVQTHGYERYSIFRPGLLLTDRSETRVMEYVFQKIYPSWILPENAKAVSTVTVAKAMAVNSIREPAAAEELYTNGQIRQMQVGKQ